MADRQIEHISAKEAAKMEAVGHLFTMMYEEMERHGLMVPLRGGGAGIWLKGIAPALGKLSLLVAAIDGEKVTGFAHGSLKFTPDYLGNKLVGAVTHIYVLPEFRSRGIARKMLDELESWFKGKGVHSIELQVVNRNEGAHKFWEACGYTTELKQFRKKAE
jgi:GNAT superfamily N-acetyltransferase